MADKTRRPAPSSSGVTKPTKSRGDRFVIRSGDGKTPSRETTGGRPKNLGGDNGGGGSGEPPKKGE